MRKASEITRFEHKIKRLSTLIDVNALINSSLNLDKILIQSPTRNTQSESA